MAALTTKQRNDLYPSDFAIPSKRMYPVENIAHARAALARVSQFGTDYQKRIVKAAVYKKYPGLKHRALARSR